MADDALKRVQRELETLAQHAEKLEAVASQALLGRTTDQVAGGRRDMTFETTAALQSLDLLRQTLHELSWFCAVVSDNGGGTCAPGSEPTLDDFRLRELGRRLLGEEDCPETGKKTPPGHFTLL